MLDELFLYEGMYIAVRPLVWVGVNGQRPLFAAVVISDSSDKRDSSVGVIERALRSMLQLFNKNVFV